MSRYSSVSPDPSVSSQALTDAQQYGLTSRSIPYRHGTSVGQQPVWRSLLLRYRGRVEAIAWASPWSLEGEFVGAVHRLLSDQRVTVPELQQGRLLDDRRTARQRTIPGKREHPARHNISTDLRPALQSDRQAVIEPVGHIGPTTVGAEGHIVGLATDGNLGHLGATFGVHHDGARRGLAGDPKLAAVGG